MTTIAVQNHSSVVSDADVQKWIAAQQIQVTHDYAAVYGKNAHLQFFDRKAAIPSYAWQVQVLDNSDQAGALGYHDLTKAGKPLSKIFAKDDLKYGYAWTVTASHEVLEMLADPYDCLTSVDDENSRLYFYEVADAVEDDRFAYLINGVKVSDFVLPEWFVAGTHGKSLSFKGNVHSAFELAAGGYIGYLDFSSAAGWQQLTPTRTNARVAIHTGSEVVHADEHPKSPRTTRRLKIYREGRGSLVRSAS